MRRLLIAPNPRLAIVTCLPITFVIALAIAPLHDDVTRAVTALLLVLPVVAAAVIGGRTPAVIVAICATLAMTLTLPPIGSFRIRLVEDVVGVIVFLAVALIVSALVTTKVEALSEIDEQRRALLRSVSHDLRTPLSSIRAVATDLREGDVYQPATRVQLLDIVVQESERLDRLVGNLLSMSRIEAHTLTAHIEAVDVAELVALCTRRLDHLFASELLTVAVPDGLPLVRGDHALLEQFLNNLLDNAIRHAPGARVRVSAAFVADGVMMTVADHGPGLSAASRDQLLHGTRDGADGLGLSICHAIAALHAATLVADDDGRGTSISIILARYD
jgi:two-component system sensor histidine kinase KdpD